MTEDELSLTLRIGIGLPLLNLSTLKLDAQSVFARRLPKAPETEA